MPDEYGEPTPAERRLASLNAVYNPKKRKPGLEADEETEDFIFGMDPYTQADITDEDLSDIVGLGSLEEDLGENARQRLLAEEIRNRAAPEGRDSGRVYTAANPLEHLGAALEKYQARKEIKKLEEGRGGILEKQKGTRSKIADLIRGKRRKQLDVDSLLKNIRTPSLDNDYNEL